jgi:1-phosphofructokinase
MIVTVTPNPSLDITLRLDRFIHRGINRVHSSLREPSGKGLNVSLALHAVGADTIAVLPLGGPAGRELAELAEAYGVQVRIIPIDGAVRSNVSLIESDGATTKVNEPGPELSEDEVTQVVDDALNASQPHSWLAYCGSLPRGFSPIQLARAIALAKQAGRNVALDTSDAALQAVLSAPQANIPTVIKPNTHELAHATSRRILTLGDVVDAADVVLQRGVETVLVSLGGDGGVLLDRAGALYGQAPVDRVVNTVGAGDSFFAGYLCARDRDLSRKESLAMALRWGAIAVQHAGTVFPGLGDHDTSIQLGPVVTPEQPLSDASAP